MSGSRFVFAADEFYLLAGEPLPEGDAYEGFPMLENGVGMVQDFLGDPLPSLPTRLERPRKVILGTGRLFAPVLERAVKPLGEIEGVTDLQGNFNIDALKPGNYTLRVISTGYVTAKKNVVISAGANGAGTITLQKGAAVSGTITKPDGSNPDTKWSPPPS